ncbi:hypothetical protein DFH29DRAFT_897777 [Suillus ampliporus]|nr:hypothetical protein DFH29DRAFT_897777 [Suillus ampliporus]
MDFSHYLHLCIVPFVACLLIRDNLGCAGWKAISVMHDSADAGEVLQPLDDVPDLITIRDDSTRANLHDDEDVHEHDDDDNNKHNRDHHHYQDQDHEYHHHIAVPLRMTENTPVTLTMKISLTKTITKTMAGTARDMTMSDSDRLKPQSSVQRPKATVRTVLLATIANTSSAIPKNISNNCITQTSKVATALHPSRVLTYELEDPRHISSCLCVAPFHWC